MSALSLKVTAATSGGWSAEWRLNATAVGEPLPVSPEAARFLASSVGEFDRLFDRSDGVGHALRPLLPAGALTALGQQLFDAWCRPVWDAIAPRLTGQRQLVVH